jgi:hypothetical protein
MSTGQMGRRDSRVFGTTGEPGTRRALERDCDLWVVTLEALTFLFQLALSRTRRGREVARRGIKHSGLAAGEPWPGYQVRRSPATPGAAASMSVPASRRWSPSL